MQTVKNYPSGPQGRPVRLLAIFLITLLPAGLVSASPFKDKPNVLLVLIDTLRSDRISGYGYPGKTTPNMDKLMAEGTMFNNAYSPTNRTTPAIASLLTGVHLGRHGYVGLGYDYVLNKRFITLPELFKANGYSTAAISASVAFSSLFGVDQGFDYFDDKFVTESNENEWWGHKVGTVSRIGEDVTNAVIEYADLSPKSPFFLMVHYFDPHGPNESHPAFRDRFPTPYDEDVAYTDKEIGRMLGALEKKGLLEKTVLIVTADHGENLQDQDNRFSGHEEILENTVRIPLFIKGMGIATGTTDVKVSLQDIFATIHSGLPVRIELPYVIDASDLTPFLEGNPSKQLPEQPIFLRESYKFGSTGNLGVIHGVWKLVAPFELDQMMALPSKMAGPYDLRQRAPQLYNLAVDPKAQRDLNKSEPEKLRELNEILTRWQETQQLLYPCKAQPNPSQERIEAMKALGYLR